MASFPNILQFINKHATPEAIKQGRKIYQSGGVYLKKNDQKEKQISFKVVEADTSISHEVAILHYDNSKDITTTCDCSYNMGETCRHEVAALLKFQELIDQKILKIKTQQYQQEKTTIAMKGINPKTLRLLTSRKNYLDAGQIARHHAATIKFAEKKTVEAKIAIEKKKYKVKLVRTAPETFETSCNCTEYNYPLCQHKVGLFLQLLNAYGEDYFDSLKNWDKQKNKLLSLYGYSLEDDLKGKFEFTYKEGKPFLRVLDRSIKRVKKATPAKEKEKREESAVFETKRPGKAIVLPQGVRAKNITGNIQDFLSNPGNNDADPDKRLGVVLHTAEENFPYFQIDLVVGRVNEKEDAFTEQIQKLDLTRYIDYYSYNREDRELIAPIRQLQNGELKKYLERTSDYTGLWDFSDSRGGIQIPRGLQHLIVEYFHNRLKKLIPILSKHGLVYIIKGNGTSGLRDFIPLAIGENKITPEFKIKKQAKGVELSCFLNVKGKKLPVDENESKSPLFFLKEGELNLMDSVKDVLTTLPYSRHNPIQVSAAEWPDLLTEEILPLSHKYKVHFPENLIERTNKMSPKFCIRFKELNQMLLIKPMFQYGDDWVEWNEGKQIMAHKGDRILLIQRDKETEESFIDSLRKFHPKFEKTTDLNYFHLHSNEALSNGWFLHFLEFLKNHKIEVEGLNHLKKFRFNQFKPQTKVEFSSNIDWFDARVSVAFGEQTASIREIKKALSRRRNYVPLSDGSLGILPEKWMEKYGLLFRMGQEGENGLKISKYNFGIIDELYEHIDDESLLAELEEKRQALLDFESLPKVPVPSDVQVKLRDYQKSGLQWLSYLDDIKWGGILADDMGLGKTLQTLSFLQHYKNEKGKCFALVVCPTSLLFNWESEIKKFTPDLSYVIHHGPTRSYNSKELAEKNVVLTSYGTLRSDIRFFLKFEFDYAILDESQSIKNPNSKVTKAARLLNALNRFCLSGTPMQNNTFDIYSQMNFLNPGMLGSIDFFKTEFSQPIDKAEDPERKEHLRKLIYPFILRRTKEQVAKDLPEKTEMVIFCEMDKEQREVYNAYRDLYRSKILGTIDEQGMGGSRLTILQGLMKLRQICDSPAILKDDTYRNYSIKLDELSRELQENAGSHKVLIFSQFLGMLGLIRKRLEKLGIPYQYFDGSTNTTDREKAIYQFQNDDNQRVFLISLKAGGVGLNLTAADYVYIVDPWWNPAVEEQAIDRTHRIGQTKNIFAYRMICKGTIEEKILELQEKKKTLVKDVISDESGFVKKLTKEDVMYLFT